MQYLFSLLQKTREDKNNRVTVYDKLDFCILPDKAVDELWVTASTVNFVLASVAALKSWALTYAEYFK
jgi:hypothetical protein